MKTKIKNKNSFTKILSVTVPWKDLSSDYQVTFDRMKNNYTPPGGRKGKVTGIHLQLFKKNYKASIEAQFAENSVNKYYKKALDEMELSPINQGKIIELKFHEEDDLNFEIEFEHKPDFRLPNYQKKFKISAIKYIPSDEDLDDALKDLQNRFSTMDEVKDGAKDNHFLFVDLQELDNGAPIIGKKIEKQYIRLGFGAFKGPALDSLSGIKKGETRNVSIELEGKKMDYEVLVHKIENQNIPELNDDFAKTADPKTKNLNDLKKKINNNIIDSFEQEHTKAINNSIINYFVDKTKIEAPESMINNYLDHLVENNKAQQPNMTEDAEKELRSNSLEGAMFNVKWYLIKEKIISSEKLNISEKDMKNKQQELMDKDPSNAENVEKFLKIPENKQRFFDDLLSEKLFDHLREFANVKVEKKKTDELRKQQGGSK